MSLIVWCIPLAELGILGVALWVMAIRSLR